MLPTGGVIEKWEGSWIGEDSFPSANEKMKKLYLSSNSVLNPLNYYPEKGGKEFLKIHTNHLCGVYSGAFLSFGEPDGPYDQR